MNTFTRNMQPLTLSFLRSMERQASSLTDVQLNLEEIRAKISTASDGRTVRLVAVSKFQPKEAIKECYLRGQRHFGENYIQELEEKSNALKEECPEIKWHYIGQIQSNKIPKIVSIPNLYCVETLESEKHCTLMEKSASKAESIIRVLLQVNTSREEQKGGVRPEEAVSLSTFVLKECPHLKLDGFMTIGSIEGSHKIPNPDFEVLVDVRKRFAQSIGVSEDSVEVSMGMSSDMEQAIRQGSTSVRVGTSIFGARNYNK